MSTGNRNDFLLGLLALQQDGKGSISAPSNWTTQAPLLEVETEVDEVIKELQEAILQSNGRNRTARWHFFIGSPGNGKSAAMGKICKQLLSNGNSSVRDESGVSIQDLGPTAIPYAIHVFEGDNNFASALIVQDASVVRNPFSSDVDPAAELLQTLERAWQKGISLIVCTNRGVLEKAHRDSHTNQDVNCTSWFKILKAIVEADASLAGKLQGPRSFEDKKTVFDDVAITYSYLDNRSLLLGQDTFDKLIQKAVEPANWKSCEACPVKQTCPFKANQDYLSSLDTRQHFLQLLRRAEVYSGQVIVFREALALISLILAGCPRDYEKMHPCEWVERNTGLGDIFALAMRRIYMCLSASFCPYGLEAIDRLRKRQLEALRMLRDALDDTDAETKKAISCVIDSHHPPSTDVGVTRLLGADGVIASIDSCNEPLPIDFYDRWDSDFEAINQTIDSAGLGLIEKRCVSVWRKLEETIEFAAEHWTQEAHWAIRRWSSNYLLHLGAFIEMRTAWSDGLDKFTELLGLMRCPPSERKLEEKRKIRELDSKLEELLDAIGGKEAVGTVKLSDNVTLAGNWVVRELKPKTTASGGSGSVSLSILFEGGERATLAAPMYLWLTRRAMGNLDQRCFPSELLVGATDARVRAAAKGKYAFQNNDVEMIIEAGEGNCFKVIRLEGEAYVQHE